MLQAISSNRFILPDKKLKQQVLNQSDSESSEHVTITKKGGGELFGFEEGIKCKQ